MNFLETPSVILPYFYIRACLGAGIEKFCYNLQGKLPLGKKYHEAKNERRTTLYNLLRNGKINMIEKM